LNGFQLASTLPRATAAPLSAVRSRAYARASPANLKLD
jgi:hypothetical protein